MKKSIKYVSVSTIILALIVITIFGISADAAGGVKTKYGKRLQEQSPESLDSSYAGWSWVDTDSNDYFGNVGQQAFVITKGGKYKNITVDVEPKEIKPTVKVGSSESTIPPLWAGNSSKAKISSYQHTVTVTAGTGGSVSGSGTYTQGDDYTITATASSGYKFSKWSDNNTSASRTITMGNSNVSYIATFEATNTMAVTNSLPTKVGDVSIMPLNILCGLCQTDPNYGYSTSTYYVYGICDSPGATDSATGSTSANLKSVGLSWYRQLKKPTSVTQTWTQAGHEVFGGPFDFVGNLNSGYRFVWWNSTGASSSEQGYWCCYVNTSVYVAVVRAR